MPGVLEKIKHTLFNFLVDNVHNIKFYVCGHGC